jgi:hypothetical protein
LIDEYLVVEQVLTWFYIYCFCMELNKRIGLMDLFHGWPNIGSNKIIDWLLVVLGWIPRVESNSPAFVESLCMCRSKFNYDKGNNKITELRTILQRESQNS